MTDPACMRPAAACGVHADASVCAPLHMRDAAERWVGNVHVRVAGLQGGEEEPQLPHTPAAWRACGYMREPVQQTDTSSSAMLWNTAQRLAATTPSATPAASASSAHRVAPSRASTPSAAAASARAACEDAVDLGGVEQWTTTEQHTAAMLAERRRHWPPPRGGGGGGSGGGGGGGGHGGDGHAAGAWRRSLFPSRPYGEQPAAAAERADVELLMAAVTSPGDSRAAPMACKLLLKLILDQYLADEAAALPLTLSLLQQQLLKSPHESVRLRCFDLLLNLAVHGHLITAPPSFAHPPSPSQVSVRSYPTHKHRACGGTKLTYKAHSSRDETYLSHQRVAELALLRGVLLRASTGPPNIQLLSSTIGTSLNSGHRARSK